MMGILPQRRLRFIVLATLFTTVFIYIFHHGNDSSVTWHAPISSPATLAAEPVQPPLKGSTIGFNTFTEDAEISVIPEGPPSAGPTISKEPSAIQPDTSNPPLPPLPLLSLQPDIATKTIEDTPGTPVSTLKNECVKYEVLQRQRQKPLSEGWRQFPYSRPDPECRTFHLPAMEDLMEKMKRRIKDPDLFRLFENSYPNTLDTMIKWRGYAKVKDEVTGNETITDEELTYVITGDIDAMWLRDSASQIYSYLPLLEASTAPDSLASLWRGLINIHARYIIISPYCHSFQPPPESGVAPTHNGAYSQNHPNPPYNPKLVFDCKWELDSLASFLQISSAYYQRTNDLTLFSKYKWIEAVDAAVKAASAMRLGTYSKNGEVEKSAWTFTGWTNRGSETLTNDGLGNPTKENGMVRTAFRPSDDACIYQLLVPANMMFAKYLEEASVIMEKLTTEKTSNLTTEMRDLAYGIRKGIDRDAIVHHREFGDIFAYEVDGYGGANLMDDANVPSLLAMPLWNFTESRFRLPPPLPGQGVRDYKEIYQNTRRFVLSDENPYFMRGPVIEAVGGPHIGPGKAWPMAAVIRALTALEIREGEGQKEGANEVDAGTGGSMEEVTGQIMMILNSTDEAGVIHESVNSWNEKDWTRAWFGWANGLFGELIIKVAEEEKGKDINILGQSWQG